MESGYNKIPANARLWPKFRLTCRLPGFMLTGV